MPNKLLQILNFFNKGWEVSLLAFLPFIQAAYHLDLIQISLLSTIYVLFQIAISLFAGQLVIRFGSKRMIQFSFVCFLLAWGGFNLPHQFLFLLPIYACGGLGSGIFDPVGSAQIAKTSTQQKRGQQIGNYGAIGDMGRIGVAALSTLLIGLVGWQATTLIFLVLVSLLIVSIAVQASTSEPLEKLAKNTLHIRDLLKNPALMLAIAAGALDSFASSSLYIFLPFLLAPKGISLASSGLLTALFFGGYLAGRLLLGRSADQYGKAKILILAESCMAGLILLLVWVNAIYLVIPCLFGLGVFTRGTSPVIKAMVADAIQNPQDFEQAYGYYSFVTRSSSLISRPAFGFSADQFGIGVAFYLAAIAALLTALPAYWFKRLKHAV